MNERVNEQIYVELNVPLLVRARACVYSCAGPLFVLSHINRVKYFFFRNL